MAAIIGIKLGTYSSAVAVVENGKPTAIRNHEGSYVTPSVVAYNKDGTCLIGHLAKQQAVLNPQNTFDSVMRLLGRNYDEVAQITQQFSYEIRRDPQGGILIDCPILQRQFTPEDVLAKLLRQLVEDASQYLGTAATQVVLEVPAGFGLIERLACKEAARIAGLEVRRVIDSPLASALSYGLNRKYNEMIVVFKLGAGHLSVSVLKVDDGVFDVLATWGDTQLGGNDFDRKIVNWLIDTFGRSKGIDFRPDPQVFRRLVEVAEVAKIELSEATETEIYLPYLTQIKEATDLKVTLTRDKFEELCSDLLDRCRSAIDRVLQDAELTTDEIDRVLLVGGCSRIPSVHRLIQEIFGKEPSLRLNQDELCATGAAIQAGVLAGELIDFLSLEVTPLSLGVETLGGVMTKILPGKTTFPTKKSEDFSTAVDGQTVVEIHVLEGEGEMANDNKSLGIVRLDGFPPAPRGVPQIEVTFDIDANLILTVSAKDKGTGKEQSISITEMPNRTGQKPVLQYPPVCREFPYSHTSSPPMDVVGLGDVLSRPHVSSYPPNHSVADWKYCPYCSQELSPPLRSDAKFCPHCRHPFYSHPPFKPIAI